VACAVTGVSKHPGTEPVLDVVETDTEAMSPLSSDSLFEFDDEVVDVVSQPKTAPAAPIVQQSISANLMSHVHMPFGHNKKMSSDASFFVLKPAAPTAVSVASTEKLSVTQLPAEKVVAPQKEPQSHGMISLAEAAVSRKRSREPSDEGTSPAPLSEPSAKVANVAPSAKKPAETTTASAKKPGAPTVPVPLVPYEDFLQSFTLPELLESMRLKMDLVIADIGKKKDCEVYNVETSTENSKEESMVLAGIKACRALDEQILHLNEFRREACTILTYTDFALARGEDHKRNLHAFVGKIMVSGTIAKLLVK